MSDPFTLLLAGQFMDAMAGVYTGLIGNAFFYFLILFGGILVWIKTQDTFTLGVMSMIILSGVVSLMAGQFFPTTDTRVFYIIMSVAMIFGIGAMVYRVLRSGNW